MQKPHHSFVHRLIKEETGQVLPWAVILLTMIFVGLSALVVDVGRTVVAYHKLQAATDAAAMAGAQLMPTATGSNATSSVISQATLFSAAAGNNNANGAVVPGGKMVSGYPKLYCSSTVAGWGVVCNTALTSAAGNGANAIVVSETSTVPMYFAALIGVPSITVTATSTAAMRGSPRNPYNVAIIIDTTASMKSTDGKTSNCSGTRVACALQGALTLLGDLSPCASGGSCGSVVSGTTNVANPLDEVSIYTFPGLVSTTAATNDGNCGATMVSPGSSKSTISYYNYPTLPVYQITPYSSNYASQDPSSNTSSAASSSYLSSSALLVQASGGKKGCGGLQAVGGASTYYAGVIYQAQADLVAQQSARLPTQTQNVMIVLSDGDAEASSTDMTSTNYNGTYPSIFNECKQAVTAAKAATAAGTTVYTVAYGTQSGGCDTDKSSASYSTGSGKSKVTYTNTNPSNLTPCQAMQQMASSASTFYSDFVAGGNGGSNDGSCAGASGSDTSINNIFSYIAGNLSTARLVPNGLP